MKSLLIALLLLPLAGARADNGVHGLAWLAGHWVTADGAAEEGWFAPKGGAMPGVFRWVFPNGGQVLEFLVIEEVEEGVFLRFKHFGTDYVPWEKDAPLSYRLDESAHNHAVFERLPGQAGGFQTMRYDREGDTLRVSADGAADGSSLLLEYHRYRTPPALPEPEMPAAPPEPPTVEDAPPPNAGP